MIRNKAIPATCCLCLSVLLATGCSTSGLKNGAGSEKATAAEQGGQARTPLAMPSSLAVDRTLASSAGQNGDMPSASGLGHRLILETPNVTDAVWSSPNALGDPSATQALDRRIILAQSSGEAAAADAGPPAPAGDDLAALAQKANNPISDAWLLITQNDTTIIDGDAIDTEVINSLKFQPVLSVPVLEGDWNFVIRPVLQFQSLPFDEDVGDLLGASPNDIVSDPDLLAIAGDPDGRTNGLGDSVLLTLLGPNTDDGWIYAGGLTQILPTASEDVLGQEKWQAGPAALVVRLGNDYGGFGLEDFNVGFLAQQWWSYAGDDDRDSTNQMDIQYFINWKATPTQLIGMTPNISINWDADGSFFDDQLSFPIGLGTIGLFKVGKLPVRYGLEAQYYLTGPDAVEREANFRFFIAPIIANPFK